MNREEILSLLNEIEIKTEGWERSENIMTFNGIPIGMTISKRNNIEIDRWWPSLKREIAKYISENDR